MTNSKRSGLINQAMNISPRSKIGTLSDEPIRTYEELISLVADNTVTITYEDSSVSTAILNVNTHLSFNNAFSITTSGDVIVS